MTIIEFLDEAPIENVVSTLANKPERVIFIAKQVSLGKFMPALRKCIGQISPDTEIIEVPFQSKQYKLENVVKRIKELLDKYEDCHIDISGGGEYPLVAAGYLMADREHEIRSGEATDHVQVHKYVIRNGKIVDCDHDGNNIAECSATLSIDEYLMLSGACVTYDDGPNSKENGCHRWVYSDELRTEINSVWRVAKATSNWNTQASILAEKILPFNRENDPLKVKVYHSQCKAGLNDYDKSRIDDVMNTESSFLVKLQDIGVIHGLSNYNNMFVFEYKNDIIRRVLEKAGNILELEVFVTLSMMGEVGTIRLDDIKTGVLIDWDSEIHPNGDRAEYETNPLDIENEIDLILMQGLTPIFISCKNGDVPTDELYKFATVADRFGGKYVKKILIASRSLDVMQNDGSYKPGLVKERASQMGIHVIDDYSNFRHHGVNEIARLEEYLK